MAHVPAEVELVSVGELTLGFDVVGTRAMLNGKMPGFCAVLDAHKDAVVEWFDAALVGGAVHTAVYIHPRASALDEDTALDMFGNTDTLMFSFADGTEAAACKTGVEVSIAAPDGVGLVSLNDALVATVHRHMAFGPKCYAAAVITSSKLADDVLRVKCCMLGMPPRAAAVCSTYASVVATPTTVLSSVEVLKGPRTLDDV